MAEKTIHFNKKERNQQAVIVGAGPGGLGAAMLLASAGVDVTVLEAQDRVGGRTSAFEEEGYRFDLGPTFFLYPEALRSLYRMCGRRLEDDVDLMRIDPHYRLVFGGREHLEVTPEPEQMQHRIAELSRDDAAAFPRYLEANRDKLEKIAPILQRPFSSILDLLKLPLAELLPAVRPWSSVDGDLSRFFSDPRIRLAFSFQSKYLGMSPFNCPSLFTILSFMEYEYGIFHPKGGCGAVSQAMADAAVEMGAKIRLGEPVTELDFDGRRVVGVRTEQARYRCDAAVINADFAHAMKRLVPDGLRRRWNDRSLDRKKYSCSTFMMYLGLEGETDLPHHTIFLADDYRRNLDDIERRRRLSEDPSIYVCNPAVTDPSMAPEGHSALYVLVPVPHQTREIDWGEQQATMRSRVLRKLESVGIRDVEKRCRFERVLTPRGWQNDLRIHRGATFNLAHSLDQMLHLRPQNRFEDLDGVYLVGGGTHPGSGLPVIFESSKITSRLIAEDLALNPGWDRPGEEAPLAAALSQVG